MIDETMEDEALARIAQRREGAPENAAQIWLDIQADFRKAGPITAMILRFRTEATDALAELTMCDPKDAVEIGRLQGVVQRLLLTIEIVQGYRDTARAGDVNSANDLTDDEQTYIANIED